MYISNVYSVYNAVGPLILVVDQQELILGLILQLNSYQLTYSDTRTVALKDYVRGNLNLDITVVQTKTHELYLECTSISMAGSIVMSNCPMKLHHI